MLLTPLLHLPPPTHQISSSQYHYHTCPCFSCPRSLPPSQLTCYAHVPFPLSLPHHVFEQCDFNIGVYWAFQSLQRVVSVGSRMFVCEAVQWEEFGGPYLPWPPTFVGPGGQRGPDATSWWGPGVGAITVRDCHVDGWTGPMAINVSGTLQVQTPALA
jgi:hypothetical protein